MFPWFGSNQSKISIAEADAKSNYENFTEARNKLFYRVKAAFYEITYIDKTIGISESNLVILRSLESLSLQKFEAGTSNMVDVIRAQLQINNLISEINVLRTRRAAMLEKFNLLLNREPDQLLELKPEDDTQDHIIMPNDSTLFNQHPMLQSLNYKFQAARERERLAKLNGLPNLGLGIDYLLIGNRDDMVVEDNGKNAFMPMISISLPIYRKKYKSYQKEATLLQESVVQEKEQLLNSLQSDFADASWELSRAEVEMDLYTTQINQANQARSINNY